MKYLRERLKIKEYLYPYPEKINPALYSLVEGSEDDIKKGSKVHAKMTKWDLKSVEVELLLQWIKSLIQRDFTSVSCECRSVWGIMYNQGDYVEDHNHKSSYSFSYYVNVPKGSSPLMFTTSGHKVKVEVGKLVLFESRLNHYTLPNKCNQRCIISGNFVSTPILRGDY